MFIYTLVLTFKSDNIIATQNGLNNADFAKSQRVPDKYTLSIRSENRGLVGKGLDRIADGLNLSPNMANAVRLSNIRGNIVRAGMAASVVVEAELIGGATTLALIALGAEITTAILVGSIAAVAVAAVVVAVAAVVVVATVGFIGYSIWEHFSQEEE